MPPYRQGAAAMLIGAWLWTPLCAPACAAPPPARPSKELRAAQAERHYQAGIGFYVKGDHSRALAAFEEALTLDPGNSSARAAVKRLALETSRPAPALPEAAQERSPVSPLEEAIDDFLLRQVPRYFLFERTVGDSRADQGTLTAMHGRVAQMMIERKRSLARGRAFAKEQELRALVRRLPAVLA